MNIKKVFLLSVLVLTACSNEYASNGEKYYKHSHNGPGLFVPPPLTSTDVSHFYDLPAQKENATVSIRPPH